MADPANLVTAPVQVGLLERAFTGTELAAEADRLVCSARADVA